ncbi:MAG TPA: FAD-dependent monooxygenase [Mycobacterium sp.]|nr:FAD-dependent monooxygenase [Mycobacterium sp.]
MTVEFDDGSISRYDLVVGADGIHSQVRELVVGAAVVRPVGQLAWRFVTKCPPAVTTWTVLFGRRVSFLAVPIGRGKVYCYCDALTNSAPGQEADDVIGQLARLLAGFTGPVQAILDALGPNGAVYVSPIEEVILDEWARGSVLLIGDAAHATSPNMAQGAAMALEDGLVLAECLAAAGGVPEALVRFQARRRPRTQWVLAQTHRRDRTRNLTPALRNLLLRRWGRNIFHANYRPLLDLP